MSLKFCSSDRRTLSRDELLDRVWGENEFPSNRTIDNVIVRLRQVLGGPTGGRIVSVRGIGYQFLKDPKEGVL